MSMERASHEIEDGRALRKQDAEHIHALVCLAEIQQQRITISKVRSGNRN